MKIKSPLAFLNNATSIKTPMNVICFIDDREVSLKECGVEIEALEISTSNYWDKECARHPTSSHCKIYSD